MKKTLAALLLAGTLFNCELKNPFIPKEIEDNTNEQTFIRDTTFTPIDTTITIPDTLIVPIDTTFYDTFIVEGDTTIIPLDTTLYDTTIITPDTLITPPDTIIIPIDTTVYDTTIIPPDTTIIPPDTTIIDVPVERNDFNMYLNILTMTLNDTLDYESILQTTSDETVTLNNRRIRDENGNVLGWDSHAIINRVYLNGELYFERPNKSDILIKLWSNGYLKGKLEGNEEYTEVSNASILLDVHRTGEHFDISIPYPLVFSKIEVRHEPERDILTEIGNYLFEVEINYSVEGEKYKSIFESDEMYVGGLEKRIYPIKLEMRRE